MDVLRGKIPFNMNDQKMSYKSKKQNLAADLHHNQNHNIFFNGYESTDNLYNEEDMYHIAVANSNINNKKVITPDSANIN